MFNKLHALGMNDDLRDRVRGLGSETWKGRERVELLVVLTRLRGSGIISPDLPIAISVKVSAKDGKLAVTTFPLPSNIFHKKIFRQIIEKNDKGAGGGARQPADVLTSVILVNFSSRVCVSALCISFLLAALKY